MITKTILKYTAVGLVATAISVNKPAPKAELWKDLFRVIVFWLLIFGTVFGWCSFSEWHEVNKRISAGTCYEPYTRTCDIPQDIIWLTIDQYLAKPK